MNDTTKVDTSALLANLKNKTDPAPEVSIPVVTTAVEKAPPPQPTAVEVPEYQQYTSARVSICLFTPTGKRINFTNYQYHTKDPEIMAYLDSEISQGLQGFTKGKLLTAAQLDPETAKKRAIIEEFKASQEGREFGNTKPESERTKAVTSGQVAN